MNRKKTFAAFWLGISFGNAIAFALFLGACTALSTTPSKPYLQEPRTDHGALPKSISTNENFCAWFGDAQDGVLYFGISAFWNEYRRDGNNPLADLERNGPLLIGRYDLAHLQFLPSLSIETEGAPTGSWDVLAHPNGRIYFSSLFDISGSVDSHSGAVERFTEAGLGLNELALGPNQTILASRYVSETSGRPGSVVWLSESGKVLGEFPLHTDAGYTASPKTVAYDASMQRIWVVSDLIPTSPANTKSRYDTRVLDLQGRELLRIETPEIFFVRFDTDGTGYLALRNAQQLELQILPPQMHLPQQATLRGEQLNHLGPRVLLNENFSPYDFVQEITLAENQVVLTSWSGEVHVLHFVKNRGSVVWHTQLPASDENGLYYTGVVHDAHLCATYCSGIAVSCIPLPSAMTAPQTSSQGAP